jgi:aspartate/methionine/tyrosine aminotransferase
MNDLAKELNESLADTVVARLLGELGKEMFFPKGIVAQTAEAKGKATRFNATVGMAFENGKPMILPGIAERIQGLDPSESVAYAPTPGVAQLRDKWAEQIRRKNPGLDKLQMSRPIVVSGLTNGLFQLAELFCDPGDVVIIPDLFWGNYRLMFETRRGAKLVTFPFFTDDHSSMALSRLTETIVRYGGSGKIILLFNFPNNPAGYTPSRAEAEQLVGIIRKQAEGGIDFLVISDDAYFGLFYEESFDESLFSLLAGCHERVLAAKVDGATKEDFAWGLRVGFVTFAGPSLRDEHYSALEKKMMGAIRSSISNSSNLGQNLVAKLLEEDSYEDQKRAAREKLLGRYRALRSFLSEKGPHDLLAPLPFNSGYFMSFEVRLGGAGGAEPSSGAGATGDAQAPGGAEELRLALLEEGIGTISIQDRYLRIAYAGVDEERIPELFEAVFAKAEELAKERRTI